jgi:hypothetical protein
MITRMFYLLLLQSAIEEEIIGSHLNNHDQHTVSQPKTVLWPSYQHTYAMTIIEAYFALFDRLNDLVDSILDCYRYKQSVVHFM